MIKVHDIETEFGSVKLERYDFCGEGKITITTENYPECEQGATLTRAQFEKFIAQCQKILKEWPEEPGQEEP